MKTVNKTLTSEIIIKNSRFITYIYHLNSPDITSILQSIKDMHPKATHYCYGYIYNEISHSNDDNEPSGTAGQPILNVLQKEDLNQILCVVVRYFGGIKLGAGGLVRAYTKAVTNTLKDVEYLNLIKGYKLEINIPYEEEKNVRYILSNSEILQEEYQESIKYLALVNEDIKEKLIKYNIKIISEELIKEII